MYNPFIIKELLCHILSYVPKSVIIPCALVSKDFNNAIKIDYDQESVAKNSDMFSLLKIPYSPKVVINIATLHNNIDMVDYLINKYDNIIHNKELWYNIGYMGNEYLLNKIKVDRVREYMFLSHALVGITDGLHMGLFEKYKKYTYFVFRILTSAYKSNCKEIRNKILINDNGNFSEIGKRESKLSGKCARKDKDYVLAFIKKCDNDIENNRYYTNECWNDINSICNGLLEGEHYDIYMWFMDKEKNKYKCCEIEIIKNLIRTNNYAMFTHILLNNCERVISYEYGSIEYYKLVMYCINYRRVHMLTFLINYVTFNNIRYQEFLVKAISLKFNDITNALISNSHLFKEYDE